MIYRLPTDQNDSGGGTDGTIVDVAWKTTLYDQMDGAFVHAVEVTFTETTGAGVYTGSHTLPAGAMLLDIFVQGVALWTAATSAVMKVGDVADDDGFYIGVDLKATELLAAESISFAFAGGQAGAYIVAGGPHVLNRYSASSRVISGIVTTVGATGNAGRTRMTVIYSTPLTAAIIAATKV